MKSTGGDIEMGFRCLKIHFLGYAKPKKCIFKHLNKYSFSQKEFVMRLQKLVKIHCLVRSNLNPSLSKNLDR